MTDTTTKAEVAEEAALEKEVEQEIDALTQPDVKLSASEQDSIISSAAGEEAPARVAATGQTGTSRAWSESADVD